MAPLQEYRRKRQFARTPEPPPARKASPEGDTFVVQKHAARRLHYDFRLEVGGVLVSWAVPKGPSLNPADKRLAVQTEDHPLDYGGFEGTIPEGNYGAGTVMVWDRGHFNVEGDGDAARQIARGEIKFNLQGEKLRGSFVLVKLKRQRKRQRMADDQAQGRSRRPALEHRPARRLRAHRPLARGNRRAASSQERS